MVREMMADGRDRYMGQWTTPVTAVLEAYVLVSFLVFLVMFMMCIHRHGCCVSVCFSVSVSCTPSTSFSLAVVAKR
jgi:hypothetical protein